MVGKKFRVPGAQYIKRQSGKCFCSLGEQKVKQHTWWPELNSGHLYIISLSPKIPSFLNDGIRLNEVANWTALSNLKTPVQIFSESLKGIYKGDVRNRGHPSFNRDRRQQTT